MEHLQETDVEGNSQFDNLLGRKAKRRVKRRRADRRRGRKMRLRDKYGSMGRPAPRPNAYADAGIGTQVQQGEMGGNPVLSGGQWIGGGGSSASEKGRGRGLIGKLLSRRKRRNRKHKKLLRAINNPRWLVDPRNHYKLKDAVRQMTIQSNNDGKVAEKMEHFRKSKMGSMFSKLKPKRKYPLLSEGGWQTRKPMLRGSHHFFNADGSPQKKGFFAKNWWIIALVGGGAFLFLTPQGKKIMSNLKG